MERRTTIFPAEHLQSEKELSIILNTDYSDGSTREYETEFGEVKLVELQAKHLPSDATSPKLEILRERSRAVGYKHSEMGNHQQLSPELDRFYVQSLSRLVGFRPIKIVVDQDCRLWADNTHWTLAALLRFGREASTKDVPYYLVDMRTDSPIIVNRPSTLIGRSRSVAMENAKRIIQRLESGWRPTILSFTIGELYNLGEYGGPQMVPRC